MARDIQGDPRLDPRVKWLLSRLPPAEPAHVESRDQILAWAASPQALAQAAATEAASALCDTEDVAPSAGLRFSVMDVVSDPDGNTIKLQVVRPDNDETVACVYYIHGGGMSSLSSFYGNYRAWARIIAAYGVAVVLVEFRNSVQPSEVPEIAPYPGGLNDCVSGFRWVHDHAAELGVDPARVVIAGDSGGGNLAIATCLRLKRDGDLARVKGLYALCPYLNGQWPDDRFPSAVENDGIYISVLGNWGAVSYGIEAFEARDPLAWPGFAQAGDVTGFPPTVISVNECDPLRDEGVAFYRLLLAAGVNARGRELLGTMHAVDVIPPVCPEVTRSTAQDLATFAAS